MIIRSLQWRDNLPLHYIFVTIYEEEDSFFSRSEHDIFFDTVYLYDIVFSLGQWSNLLALFFSLYFLYTYTLSTKPLYKCSVFCLGLFQFRYRNTVSQISIGGRYASKFRKMSGLTIAFDLRTFCKYGTLWICDFRPQSCCDCGLKTSAKLKIHTFSP
jgi:hypothetical protein